MPEQSDKEENRCKLVDIGANLSHPAFASDLAAVLQRAKEAGLTKIMVTGACEKSTEESGAIAKQHQGLLYYTAGVHPHDAKHFKEESTIDFMRTHLQENPDTCVAVGECGLDFNRNYSTREQQLHAFEKQLELACQLKKPMFIHERDAHTEMVELLEKYKERLPPAVIHCFTGTAIEAEKYIQMGLYIGLTGYLWKDRTEDGVKHALRTGLIPMERLLLETDSPYMYPNVNDKRIPADIKQKYSSKAIELHKHASFKRNEPCTLLATCELIAAHIGAEGVPPAELAEKTCENARRVFGLK